MKSKSIKANVSLNVIRTLLSVVFPLITYPYAARVLGVTNLGKISYSDSVVSYFALIASFGIGSYAIREGSKLRENRQELSVTASQLLSVNLLSTLVSYGMLFALLFLSGALREYRLLILIQSISIIFTTLSADWLNTVFEDYLYICLRGISVNVVSALLLFLLVKTAEDYYIYALLSVISNAIICVMNFLHFRKLLSLRLCFGKFIKLHLKKMSVFFINAAAVSVYVSADTTMLGFMAGDAYVGLYALSVKVYFITKLVLAAIYSAALPRLSFYYSEKRIDEYKELISKIISAILLLLLPCAAGMAVLSENIVLLIGGASFSGSAFSLQILSIALVFAILGGIITQCINISVGAERVNAEATIVSAAENVILNIPFILLWRERGAAVTTLIAELTVLIYCLIKGKNIRRYIWNREIKNSLIHSLVGFAIVLLAGTAIHAFGFGAWFSLALTVVLSVAFYLCFLFIAGNPLLKEVYEKIKSRKA